MNSTQLLNRLRKHDPSRSYCITVEHWFMNHLDEPFKKFSLSILPGRDGTPCERLEGSSISALSTSFLFSK